MKTSGSSFFVLDSGHLENVKQALFGYVITPRGIVRDENALEEEELMGRGSYVYVRRDGSVISIRQDYIGSFGLYLYRDRDYFALSNSFTELTAHLVREKRHFSVNRRYLDHYLTAGLCSYAYEETPVNEIRMLDRRCELSIDIADKVLKTSYINYGENTVSPDSAKGIALLDEWFEFWSALFRSIRHDSSNIQIDLSGGFDSRLSFMLYCASGADLTDVRIRSMDDGLHTHREDFEIASEIAKDYRTVLNLKLKNGSMTEAPRSELLDMSFDAKLGFHKQMYINKGIYENPVYHITGAGGELIRPYLAGNRESFIEAEAKRGGRFGKIRKAELEDSVRSLLKESFASMDNFRRVTGQETEADYELIDFYRNTRCRNHFGKQLAESYQANLIRVTPLIDPLLNRLRCSGESCEDKNLLLAVILDRYIPQMLGYRFEGGREISPDTVSTAKQINGRYPYQKAICVSAPEEDETGREMESVTSANDPGTEDYLKKVLRSAAVRRRFSALYGEELYRDISSKMERAKFHPLSDAFAVFQICKVADDAAGRTKGESVSAYLQKLCAEGERDAPRSPERMQSLKSMQPREQVSDRQGWFGRLVGRLRK